MPRLRILVLSLFLTSVACASGLQAGSGRPVAVAAADPRFLYEGRIDLSTAAAPVLIWQASRVSLAFEGGAPALLFGKTEGQAFFDAEVDGRKTLVKAPAGPGSRVQLPQVPGGRHELVLFKRSEASAGAAVFLGVELPPGAKALKPAPPAYALSMIFFGDSITAGACNEDGAADQWEDRSTHNSAKSYAALTAAAFNADHRNIAVSGMGISEGYVDPRAGQIWDRLYPRADSPRADLAWTPNVVFVNYGENDYSFTSGQGRPFPPGFTDGYVALVRDIRAAWPKAAIVLLRGGMAGGATGEPLIAAWTAAADRLQAGDPLISRYVFRHWTSSHPRAADDEKLAAELTAWLRSQPFMRRGGGLKVKI